jgi:hypothetical protein
MKKSRLLGAACAWLFPAITSLANAAAVFYTDETTFNTAASGLTLSTEGFEAPFTTSASVNFPDLSITVNNASDLVSRASEEGGGPASTEGSRLARYYTLTPSAGGGGITISFGTSISAFSIDLIDPLDGAAIDAYFSLSNSNGDSQTLLTGGQGNNEVHFLGVIDTAQSFNTVTLFSTKPQDALLIDRIQYSLVPNPAAAWLFGSGLLGLIGLARKKAAK